MRFSLKSGKINESGNIRRSRRLRWGKLFDYVRRRYGRINLAFSDLRHANIYDVNMEGADMQGANLAKSRLNQVNLRGANMRQAYAKQAFMNYCDMSSASLNDAKLDDASFVGSDLSGAQMENTNLSDASFKEANLSNVTATRSYGVRVSFRKANLSGATFANSSLNLSSFMGANLDDTTFNGASLVGADVRAMNIEGATFDGADIHQAIFDTPIRPEFGNMQPAMRAGTDNWVEGRVLAASYTTEEVIHNVKNGMVNKLHVFSYICSMLALALTVGHEYTIRTLVKEVMSWCEQWLEENPDMFDSINLDNDLEGDNE